jgi:hypothetical protein
MKKTAGFLLLSTVLVLCGCQAIFTYSPLSGLKRDPATMTPAQRITYAQDALASGDPAAMKAAYEAIKNDTSSTAQYTAAQLGIELSGIPTVLREIASNPSSVTTQLNTISAFIASHNLDPNYMVAAAAQLAAAEAAGATLTTMDYAMETMGQLLGLTGGTWNISGLPPGTGAAMVANPASPISKALANVSSLPSGDPLKDFITQLSSYVGGI